MGFWIYIGLYTLLMVIIWGFFIIAKIHSLKFKNYQPKIVKITNIVTIILLILTILGYILIFTLGGFSSGTSIHDTVKNEPNQEIEETEETDFSQIKEDIIPENAGEDYY